mmetsp:Transcript_62072/g.131117  ORF Transcript_62072/g.131117 Transcript_62072/m.131117 type:complete len:308 (-) Transcript_62072:285-1208(-)|eukprot:CAMPEP_0206448610 /NCGR_PEP_ID=MMETSP0324_2-20121206/17572_1 /ASSEMBLY_ACC=CAM_ASM_000836 /TAXON_ID=2866 /ORGANISM="Crypthecodinium cohnii, Strain Seligo" /LENGTH=307 /DNA_ID=CAMNT_0053917781 /DNA_START=133 /DNA_END=1056 /DNA_ORIENTATION=+
MKLSAILLLGSLVGSSAGQGFKHLPKVHLPKQLPDHLPEHLPEHLPTSPSEVQKAAQDAASKAVAGAETAASEAEDIASSAAADPKSVVEEVAEKGKEVAQGAGDHKEQASKALDGAGNVIKHLSEQVANASTSDVDKISLPLPLPGDSNPSELARKIKHESEGSKDQVADAIRDVTPSISDTLSKKGTKIGETIQREAPHAAEQVDHAGESMASALHPTSSPHSSADLPLDPAVETSRMVPIVAMVAITMAAGYFVAQRFKSNTARSPILLSDALEGVNGPRGDSPQGRGGVMQMATADEAGFSRF